MRKGQSSDIIGIRMPEGITERMDRDIEKYGEHRNRTEFVLDAVKFYLDYRTNQRIETAKVKTEITKTEEL